MRPEFEHYTSENFNPDYQAITSSEDFSRYTKHIIDSGLPFGFDIESGFVGEPTSDKIAIRTMHPQWILVGFSLSYSTEEDFYTNNTAAKYIPVAHDEGPNIDNVVQVAKDLWDLLQTGRGVAHNASFELKGTGRWFREVLGNDPEYGPKVNADFGIFPLLGDSLLLAFTADLWQGDKHAHGNGNVGNDLKSVVHHRFGHKMTQFKDLFEDLKLKKQSHARFNMLPVGKKEIDYACEDALWCLHVWRTAEHDAREDEEYKDTAYKIEMALLPVVARMDQQGLPLDWAYMESKLEEAEELRQKMNDEILQEISDQLEDEVMNTNLGSPKQVSELLYDKLGIPQPRERGELSRSTAEKPLQSIAKGNKVVRDILTYRTVVKLIGSYLKKYVTTLNYGDGESPYAAVPGKAYPSHNATGAISGRFSVDGMSYQQLPKPYFYKLKSGQEYHLAFREVIQAPEGFRIVGFDYSQIQLRMMAGFAQEKNMLNAFARGIDIHTATASSMLNVPVEEVTDKQRSIGKTLNFSIVFGQGPDALANALTTPENPVTVDDAVKLLKQYYDGFPALRDWMAGLQAIARRKEFVRGLYGRRYRIWEHFSPLRGVQSKGDRTAVNEPIQGAEAIYAKLAMVRAENAIRKAGLQDKIKLVIMVHDALEFFVHESVTTQEVIDLLGGAVSYPVEKIDKNYSGFPEIKSDWHEGPNLGALVEIDLDDNNRIETYSMKVEVTGADKVKWEGKTFDSVYDKYAEWRATQHPEVLNRKKLREGTLEAIKSEVPEEETTEAKVFEIRLKQNITASAAELLKEALKKTPGPHTYKIVMPAGTAKLKGLTSGVDESSQVLISFVLSEVGGATMNEVKEGASIE